MKYQLWCLFHSFSISPENALLCFPLLQNEQYKERDIDRNCDNMQQRKDKGYVYFKKNSNSNRKNTFTDMNIHTQHTQSIYKIKIYLWATIHAFINPTTNAIYLNLQIQRACRFQNYTSSLGYGHNQISKRRLSDILNYIQAFNLLE